MKEGRTQHKQKSLSEEEEVFSPVPPPPSFSSLDYDIIDLFTPNKLGSAVETNNLLQSNNNVNMVSVFMIHSILDLYIARCIGVSSCRKCYQRVN